MIGLGTRKPRAGMPPIPSRMRVLPLDERGYPVPWFVEWIDAKPDFRVMDRRKWGLAIRFGNCWLCGQQCGRLRTFVIGPMCAVNRTTSEPPCHEDCAHFAAIACPFLTLPKAQRRDANLPTHEQPAGYMLERNPGATCLWTTIEYSVFAVRGENGAAPGRLIHLGEPRTVRWFCEGREATRDEVQGSITSGLPFLEALARKQGAQALAALEAQIAIASKYLPA